MNKKADVFLVPGIQAISDFSSTVGPFPGDREESMFGKYRPLDREFWLAKNYLSGFPLLSFDPLSVTLDADVPGILAWTKQGAYIMDPTDGSQSPADPFPTFSPYKRLRIVRTEGDPSGNVFWVVGTFLGAVFQNGQFFYAWSKNITAGSSNPQRIYELP